MFLIGFQWRSLTTHPGLFINVAMYGKYDFWRHFKKRSSSSNIFFHKQACRRHRETLLWAKSRRATDQHKLTKLDPRKGGISLETYKDNHWKISSHYSLARTCSTVTVATRKQRSLLYILEKMKFLLPFYCNKPTRSRLDLRNKYLMFSIF